MAQTLDLLSLQPPIPEEVLRHMSKTVAKVVPDLATLEPSLGLRDLETVLGALLNTADVHDLSSSHRAAAYNTLCATLEFYQASALDYVRAAILDDSIWLRALGVFLHRSENAKGKSMRQLLVVLTDMLVKAPPARGATLGHQAASTFMDILCQRQDRLKVKPALQGLAHFLLKAVISVEDLAQIYGRLQSDSQTNLFQSMFSVFLTWVVHHDTSLSAGHLIRNFLTRLRHLASYDERPDDATIFPLWMRPVTQMLRLWPDRIQEFKTHVFPHCFLPNIDEYLRFLSYLHITRHIQLHGQLPEQLDIPEDQLPGQFHVQDDPAHRQAHREEFSIFLAAIQTGKELGIIKDSGYRQSASVEIHGNTILLDHRLFDTWLYHPDGEVRLAGLFLSVFSTAVTSPIPGDVFRSLKRNMFHVHSDTDVNFRREIVGYIQRLLDRLKASTAVLARSESSSTTAGLDGPQLHKDALLDRRSPFLRAVPESLLESLHFIGWYLAFLQWELRSAAPYQRRITALRVITVILKSGLDARLPYNRLSKSGQGQQRWAYNIQISSPDLIRTLLDLVLDPFDDIRDSAISTLELCLESLPLGEKQAELSALVRALDRAEAMMLQTGRADQADGVARTYSLLFSSCAGVGEPIRLPDVGMSSKLAIMNRLIGQLEDTIEIARSDLASAVNARPIHGTFAAIRYILDQEQFYANLSQLPAHVIFEWQNTHARMCTNFEAIWSSIRDILCADAPEGHVPEEIEDEGSLDTKEVLSYSWRALKEASTLLRTIITKAPIGTDASSLITPEVVEKLGRLSFDQLVQLRHRGAFSTVAQTFAAFCRRCNSATDELLRALPERWYQETLSSIQDKASSITRRSAGIPSLIAGLLAAELQTGGTLYLRAMRDLFAEASLDPQSSSIGESRLPQVHALNCIKEIFTTSRLSIASEAHIGPGLDLAARTLNSKTWPIRNCSLMLFKALIERLLGSDETQDWKEQTRAKTSRFSYDDYPSLIGILTDLLDPNGPLKKSLDSTLGIESPLDLHGAEGVFPALQILRQASPPEANRPHIMELVSHLLDSPHWHLRDMAARTLVTLHRPHEYYDITVTSLLLVEGSRNWQHGMLLSIKYMLQKLVQPVDDAVLDQNALDTILVKLYNKSAALYAEQSCPFIRSVFLDLVNLCGMAMLVREQTPSTMEAWATLAGSLKVSLSIPLDIHTIENNALLRRSFVECFFIDRVMCHSDQLDVQWSKEYQTIEKALRYLAPEDPDTCCAALDVLSRVIQLKNPRSAKVKDLILGPIHRLFLHTQTTEIVSKAQAVLAVGLTDYWMRFWFPNVVIERTSMLTLNKLETQYLDGPPSNRESALHLLGFFMDLSFKQYPSQWPVLFQHLARYIRLLRVAIHDRNPFDSRFAAAQSISALRYIWTMKATVKEPDPISPELTAKLHEIDMMLGYSDDEVRRADAEATKTMKANAKATANFLLGLSFVLHDLLNDDDEDIRSTAAQATTRMLQAQGFRPSMKDAVPILTNRRLAQFLSVTFNRSPMLCNEALRRLTATSTVPLPPHVFARAFEHARKEDTALFTTEKQNLYKDDTLDIALWTRVLCCLAPGVASPACRSSLMDWVLDGLAAFTHTAITEGDGALGWTSKLDVFTLGMRVVFASDVLLKWRVDDASKVRMALRGLADKGKESGVHGLWMDGIERVLAEDVVRMVRDVRSSLPR
ncbi:HEAT repeat protein-like protein [Massariosphaeria phaeospora]|uniref:HEAT repeat protein-like protein n=1 Tax=Massariosphaeria phaeospora TaxID=100035 RepID=A0A7C8M1H8_9PLEO|nr:HEAT repeat protein-like protein [Massariosphaeria phaeospora]